MRNWKVVAGVAGVGAVLSLLMGVAAANPFGVIVLRVLLSGIGAGAVGFGLSLVVERFLPELGREAGVEAPGPAPGSSLDIVIPSENPHISKTAHQPPGMDAGSETASADLSMEYPEDETLSETSDLLAVAADIPAVAVLAGEGADPIAAADDAEDVGYAEAPGGDEGGTPEIDTLVADLDEIPTAEGAAPEADLEEESAGPRDTRPRRASRAGPGMDAMDIANQDPETVARAVRTMLKRDQEG